MAKINFTHITGEPKDVALFLNEWEENINDVVEHECKCDKPATLKQEVEVVEGEQKPTTKRTRKPKAEKVEEVAETVVSEGAEVSDPKDFIENTATEAELKEETISEAFDEVPTEDEGESFVSGGHFIVPPINMGDSESKIPFADDSLKITAEMEKELKEAREVIEADESEEPVKISFEMMKERAKSWCVEVKQQGHANAVELISKLFTQYGDSDTGKADRVKPELYSAVWDKLQDPATLQELVKSVSEDI